MTMKNKNRKVDEQKSRKVEKQKIKKATAAYHAKLNFHKR